MIQLFKSTDTGAPVCKGTAGALTDLLDACLVNGYSTASVTGITRSSSTATVTISANTTLRTGDYITVAGADQSEYNVTAQITVVDSTHFSYTVSGTPATPATGTITYKKAGLGWSIAYTGTNKRAYRSTDGTSNQFYLRIDDNTLVNVREAYVRGYETMSDIDTGTGPFPTTAQSTNGLSWNKSSSADTTARAWTLVGDGKTFYLFINNSVLTYGFGFGHLTSYKPSDGYNTFLAGSTQSNMVGMPSTSGTGLSLSCAWGATSANVSSPLYLARGYNQTGGAVQAQPFDTRSTAGDTTRALGGAYSGLQYPNGPDAGLWVTPALVCDFSGSVQNIRGLFPGIYVHQHSTIPQSQYDYVTGVVGLSGVTLVALTIQNSSSSSAVTGQLHVDLTGPW